MEDYEDAAASASVPENRIVPEFQEAEVPAFVYDPYLDQGLRQPRRKRPQKPKGPRRQFPLTRNKKDTIIQPTEIDLSGEFDDQMKNIFTAIRLSDDEVKSLRLLYSDIENVLQRRWPGCKTIPYGSIATGLGIRTSDADCFVRIPKYNPEKNYVSQARRVLKQRPQLFAEIFCIPRANVPLITLFHRPTHISCDITFKTSLGERNSRLVKFLINSDTRILHLVLILKYWAKLHQLSGTGKLTNYALVLLVVFYLQQPPHTLLPSVFWLQKDYRTDMTDNWNTNFKKLPKFRPPRTHYSSVAELLGNFFDFYRVFDFKKFAVCPFLGVAVEKYKFAELEMLPRKLFLYKKNIECNKMNPIRCGLAMCVQDPLQQNHNVTFCINRTFALKLKSYFILASEVFKKQKLSNCKEFLPIILSQNPKPTRCLDSMVEHFPRVICKIHNWHWKSLVRNVIITMFESSLKIELNIFKQTRDMTSESTWYMGLVTKSICKKRKRFERLYMTQESLSFEQKQAKITEEVIRTPSHIPSFQFQLALTYTKKPQSVVVAVKYNYGNFEQFRDFANFLMTETKIWFVELMNTASNSGSAAMLDECSLSGNNQNVRCDEEIVIMYISWLC